MRGFLAGADVDMDALTSFSYRGNGCPGPTRFEVADGRTVSVTHFDFWGEDESAWSLPFRCKICPDGIGEAADIVWPAAGPMARPTRAICASPRERARQGDANDDDHPLARHRRHRAAPAVG